MRCERWGKNSASLHAEGRAVDWHLDATRAADRREARRLIDMWLAPDSEGNEHALARRMGIQEIIWNLARSYRHQAFIEAPLDDVWEVVSDPRTHPDWWPDVVRVDAEGGLGEGDEYLHTSEGHAVRDAVEAVLGRRADGGAEGGSLPLHA